MTVNLWNFKVTWESIEQLPFKHLIFVPRILPSHMIFYSRVNNVFIRKLVWMTMPVVTIKFKHCIEHFDRNCRLYNYQFSFLLHEKQTAFECYVHELTSRSSHGILLKTVEIHVQKTFLDVKLMDN